MNGILKKFLRLFIVILAVTWLTFIMVNFLPGDVAYNIAGQDASLEDIEAIREELGLKDPVFVQYLRWMKDAFKGDLGKSYVNHEPVAQAILSRLPITLELLIIAQIFALALAIPLGIYSAFRPGSFLERIGNSAAFATVSVPVFVMGLALIYLFSIKLKILPATGYLPLSAGLWQNLRCFILPALSIALVEWVPLMRALRTDMITTLQQDYILMAKAKGLSTFTILFRHALKPSSFTMLTIFGIQTGHLIGGSLLVEIIFALPGIGRLMIQGIYSRDFNVVQGCILLITVSYVLINMAVDIIYFILNPKLRQE
jgi:peptide/nickel transport system permease protein